MFTKSIGGANVNKSSFETSLEEQTTSEGLLEKKTFNSWNLVEPSMGVLSKMHTNQSWITKSLMQHLNPKPTLITSTLEPYGEKLLQHL